MKSILISIKPKYCELIASGKKTVEVRKTKPKLETPFKCYIYCTKGNDGKCFWTEEVFEGKLGRYAIPYVGNGKVIGEFVCDWVESTPLWRIKGNTGFLAKRTEREALLPTRACLSLEELKKYIGSENKLIYGWHISDLVIYDKPRELSEFRSYNISGYVMDENGYPLPSHHIKTPPQSWQYIVESEDTE